MVITLDFESSNPSSSLGGASLFLPLRHSAMSHIIYVLSPKREIVIIFFNFNRYFCTLGMEDAERILRRRLGSHRHSTLQLIQSLPLSTGGMEKETLPSCPRPRRCPQASNSRTIVVPYRNQEEWRMILNLTCLLSRGQHHTKNLRRGSRVNKFLLTAKCSD